MRRSLLIGVGLLIALAGCAGHATRYTWTGEGKSMALQRAHAYCIGEANKPYIPWVAGSGPRFTLYRDCMEQQGFTKVGSDEVKLEWIENTGTRRVVDPAACRGVNMTCVIF